jgi:hypothetical protein
VFDVDMVVDNDDKIKLRRMLCNLLFRFERGLLFDEAAFSFEGVIIIE